MTQEFVTLPSEVVEQALKALNGKQEALRQVAVYICELAGLPLPAVEEGEAAQSLRAALEQPQDHVPDAGNMVPAGWKLVPVESTEEMLRAGCGSESPAMLRESLTDKQIDAIAESMPGGLDGFLKGWGWRQFARAVLEAAPQPPTVKECLTDELKPRFSAHDDAERLKSVARGMSYNDHGEAVWKHTLMEIAVRLESGGYAAPQPPALEQQVEKESTCKDSLQVEQEPYAWHYTNNGGASAWHMGPSNRLDADMDAAKAYPKVHRVTPLYTQPQPRIELTGDEARRIYNEATYHASIAVFMTRMDAEHPDADDKGVSGWLQEAEDRVKHRTIDAAHEIGQAAAPQQGEQEPVAGVVIRDGLPCLLQDRHIKSTDHRVYTHPQPAQKPLTDDQVLKAVRHLYQSDLPVGMGFSDDLDVARAIEAAHNIK